jgi:hypothetical protein
MTNTFNPNQPLGMIPARMVCENTLPDAFAHAPLTTERLPQPEDFADLGDRRAFQLGLEPF